MRKLGQWLTGALVCWALLLAVAWFTSEGEPICEGPLILSGEDSDPPTCPNRVEGLLDVGSLTLAVAIAVALLGFGATTLITRSRHEPEAVAPANMGPEPEVGD